jgi:lycopene cyclase domain-containing protein
VLKTWVIKKRDCWIVMGVMMLLTLIFDQLLTGLPIVFYDDTKRIGVELGYAPVEDFAYTFVAVILVGSILKFLISNEKANK